MKYAATTEVSVEKSKAEIESIVMRYGASGFISGWQHAMAMIEFEMKDRRIRFMLPLPDKNEKRFWQTPHFKNQRTQEQAYGAWEQACRQSWRALLLCVKAKLEAVEAKISTFEQEFMANLVLPNGLTIGETVIPHLAKVFQGQPMPPLLPSPEKKAEAVQ